MPGEFAIFQVAPATGAKHERSVMLPAVGRSVEASAQLGGDLRDERGEPAGEQSPAAGREALLEGARARRATRIAPNGDRSSIATLHAGDARGADGEQGRDLVLHRADKAPVRRRKLLDGAGIRLNSGERGVRQRTSGQHAKLSGGAKAPLEALPRRTVGDESSSAMWLDASIGEDEHVYHERGQGSAHHEEVNDILPARRKVGGMNDATHHVRPARRFEVSRGVLPVSGKDPQAVQRSDVAAAGLKERPVL